MTSSLGRILVSGASIAGPTVGYWLARYGFEVDIVERSGSIRAGGYPIDIRGSALGVVERMGLLEEIRERAFKDRMMSLVDKNGELLLKTDSDRVMNSVTDYDVEIPRGSLSSLLYEASLEAGCRYKFNDKIESLEQSDGKVHVKLASGSSESYDYVIGADGLHSATRKSILGEEGPYLRHMGYCFAGFSLPNELGLNNEAIMLSTANKMVGLGRNSGEDRAFAMFALADDTIGVRELWDPERRQAIMEERFGDLGWHIPKLLAYLKEADDVFADIVCQTHLPSWSKGRVALTGDSAHAPGFITGQGTSLALTTAYVLAGELAAHRDAPETALATYEREVRPYVESNQALAEKGKWRAIPSSEEAERQRNEMLRAHGMPKVSVDSRQPCYSALKLKDYA